MTSGSSSVPPCEADVGAGAPAGASAADAPDQEPLASFRSTQQFSPDGFGSHSHDSPEGGSLAATAAAAAVAATITGDDRKGCLPPSLSLHSSREDICGVTVSAGKEAAAEGEDEDEQEGEGEGGEEEVFHSALQLAEAGDLERLVGGCATRAHQDVMLGGSMPVSQHSSKVNYVAVGGCRSEEDASGSGENE